MNKTIRVLDKTDFHHIQSMQTSVAYDYVPQAFPNLIHAPNVLYGLFIDDTLASVGGYTVFAERLAMLGRLRSDVRFHGHGYATELMNYVRSEAFKQPKMHWVGAYTQEENKPTRRVLDKLGFTHHHTTISATTKDIAMFCSNKTKWDKVTCLNRKQKLLEQTYQKKQTYFPYESYYMLPAIAPLFKDTVVNEWTFYENKDQTRFLILKPDVKKQTYLHISYPWDDLMEQAGLWETIGYEQETLAKERSVDIYIWIDLSRQIAQTLPTNHPFELPSPWMLYGEYRN